MFRKKLFKMISFVSMFALSFSSSVVYAQEIEPVIVESGVKEFSTDGIKVFSNEEIPIEAPSFYNSYQWHILKGTNYQRLANGLEPLSMSAVMQNAADIRSQELAALFDHTRPNGSDCFSILHEKGIPYSLSGENIAAGLPDPYWTINGWMNSEGHRNNILNADFSHLGAGYNYNGDSFYGYYWTQLFVGTCSPDIIGYFFNVGAGYNTFHVGTSVDDMSLVLIVKCNDHGYSYLPVQMGMYDSNFNTNVAGSQYITVSYNGQVGNIPVIMHTYDDVGNDWYTKGVIDSAYYYGFMTGLTDTHFGVGDPLARAQLALILHRLEDTPSVEYTNIFPDVAPGQWYTDAILWASEKGIVTGYSDTGKFGPSDNINREQMAVMMYRYANYRGLDTSTKADFSRFTDAKSVNDFAKEAMQWAVGTGIITGKDNETRLDPQGNTSRAEASIILTRFAEMYLE